MDMAVATLAGGAMSQFFYVHPDTPQARLMNQAVAVIRSGGVIVYPTDSGYAIGCHLGDKSALDRIIRIRQLNKDHNFTLMCRDLSELSIYARVENQAFRLLRNNTPGPYTFVFKGTKEVPRRLLNPKRRTIGIRVPDNAISLALLEALGEPLMSTSLILPNSDVAESDPEEIRDKLEKQVDLIIHGGFIGETPTTVIDMSEGGSEIVRVGGGDPEPFQ
ncbi:threonylcarbamoyl-AMP synthase [Paraferrimonas haliotis]|uniref:Threonylcarbamoyl-AMP synthase n=2 Tax=Paraferrimonas haliotis TaxID=2013866 RepID=A0AA37TTH7_9GAMM|nr:threonylcarbamoyl-AMP synthase [Paraferrimonas haliotis]